MDDSSRVDAFLTVLKSRAPDDWHFQYNELGYWYVKHTGWVPCCELFIELGPRMVYLYTHLNIHIWPECRLALYRYALRLNEEMSGAKFGLRSQGHLSLLSLMVEWPREPLTFPAFETALETLLAYHRTYYGDIQLVAQDVDLARQVAVRELYEQTAGGEAVHVEVEKIERRGSVA